MKHKCKHDSSASHRGTAATFQGRFLSACTVQNVVKVRVSDFRESGTRQPQSGLAPDAVSFHSVKQCEQVIPRSVREYVPRRIAILNRKFMTFALNH